MGLTCPLAGRATRTCWGAGWARCWPDGGGTYRARDESKRAAAARRRQGRSSYRGDSGRSRMSTSVRFLLLGGLAAVLVAACARDARLRNDEDTGPQPVLAEPNKALIPTIEIAEA